MRSTRLFGVLVFGAAVAFSACVPLKNAPTGGGSIITESFTIGPFTLGPGQSAEGGRANVPRPVGAFGLKKARFTIVDDMGDEVPRHDIHLHHVLLIDPDTPDILCPGRGERFAGSGAERTPIAIPDPYAYMVDSGERIDALYHVMNMMPAGEDAMTVSIQYTLEYQPGATTTNTRPVKPYFLDVTGCGASIYDVPGNGGPGSIHTNTRTWTAPSDGIAVFAGGHQHGGGLGITLKKSTGQIGCDSLPTYDETDMEGHPMAMKSCSMHHLVQAGQLYRVESRYDNSMPHDDVMGIMLAYVWHGTQ